MATFISFSFQDQNKFEDVCYAFDRDGIDYWKTDEIAAGQSLRDKLQDAIRRCSICVFIATPNSLESGWCQAEIGAFWGAAKPVIVYLADDKLTEDHLPKQFKGDKFASTIREVVAAIKLHLSELPEVSQTEAVFDLAIESFVDKLTLRLKTVWFTGFGTVLGVDNEVPTTVRSANAFGQEVRYDTAKASGEAELELRAIINQIPNLRQEREKEIRNTLLKLFTEVQGQAQSISHYLGKIRFGSVTLAEPWRQIQEDLLQVWKQKSKELICFRSDELAYLRGFLEDHPEYRKVYAEEKETIESFLQQRHLSLDDLIEITRAELLESMKRLSTEQDYA